MKRNRIVGVSLMVLALGVLGTGLAVAQDTEPEDAVTSTVPASTFLEKVAANLGVTVEELETAYASARLQQIDEAVASGLLTEEEAQELKLRLESGTAMQELIDDAVASGEISQEMADLLNRQTRVQRTASRMSFQLGRGGASRRGVLGEFSWDADQDGDAGRRSDGRACDGHF